MKPSHVARRSAAPRCDRARTARRLRRHVARAGGSAGDPARLWRRLVWPFPLLVVGEGQRAAAGPDAERLRPGRPAVGLRAAVGHGAAPARPSRSSTRTTTRRPRPTSRRTAPSSACRRAPRPTAASARSTRTAARSAARRRTPAGASRSRSTSTWSRRSARTATSCSSRRPRTSNTNLGTAVEPRPPRSAPTRSRNSYGGGESSAETSGRRRTSTTRASRSPRARATTATASSTRPRRSYVTAVGGTSLTRAASARGWTETAWSGAGSGCCAYEAEAVLADRHRLRAAHGRRRLRGRRPEHRRRGLRHLRRSRLARSSAARARPRRSSRRVYALAGNAVERRLPARTRTRTRPALFDVTSGSNGTCSAGVPLHRRRRLRRPDRPRHAERRHGLLAPSPCSRVPASPGPSMLGWQRPRSMGRCVSAASP